MPRNTYDALQGTSAARQAGQHESPSDCHWHPGAGLSGPGVTGTARVTAVAPWLGAPAAAAAAAAATAGGCRTQWQAQSQCMPVRLPPMMMMMITVFSRDLIQVLKEVSELNGIVRIIVRSVCKQF